MTDGHGLFCLQVGFRTVIITSNLSLAILNHLAQHLSFVEQSILNTIYMPGVWI